MHFHRSEHWVVVSGTAKVEIGNLEKIIGPNESVYIPLKEKHRLSNPTKYPLILIEIQSGNYLEKMILKDLKTNMAEKITRNHLFHCLSCHLPSTKN